MENGETVRLGSWVDVREGSLTERWRIVNAFEADAMRRMISDTTPLARALLGHRVGETVKVRGPNGARWPVTILDVS